VSTENFVWKQTREAVEGAPCKLRKLEQLDTEDKRRISIKQLRELPPTITVEAAAALAGVGRAAGYDAVRRDEWAHIRVGRRILILTVPFLRQLGCAE
jgi:hypothetical protein